MTDNAVTHLHAPDPRTTTTARDLMRLDGRLENAMTGLGVHGIDQSESTVRKRNVHYSTQLARMEYRQSWMARREIDRPASDLIREGFKLENLPPWVDVGAVMSYLSDLGAAEVPEDRGVLPALSRLYGEGNKQGGAALVIVGGDDLPPHMPLDLDRARPIESLELLERDEISPVRLSGRATPDYYVIGASRSRVSPAAVVHPSRVILSKGARLSPSEEYTNNGWGASTLELLHCERTAVHAAQQEIAGIIHKATYDVLYIAELSELMCADGTGASIDDRISLIARSRSQHKAIPMDGGKGGVGEEPGRPSDRVESVARPVEGLNKLATTLESHWAAGTGQTPSIALGRNVGGLNTGENAGDWQSWGGYIGGEQERWLRPRLERIIEIVFACPDGPTQGRMPETWAITFPSLWKPSDKEREETRKLRAEGDKVYREIGAISGEEIGRQRFGQGVTSELTAEPVEAVEEPEAVEAPVEGLAASGPDATDVQRQALNGAQITSLFELAANVGAGALPIDTALWLVQLAIPGIDRESARAALSAAQAVEPVPLVEAIEPAASVDMADAARCAYMFRKSRADASRGDYIEQRGEQWCVLSETGDMLGCHETESEALAHLGAIEASKARGDAERSEDEQAEIRENFGALVNMGESALDAWGDDPFAGPNRKTGDARESAEDAYLRVLALVSKPMSEWTESDYDDAVKVVAFIERMTKVEQGEPLVIDGETGPSARDASLKDWGHDPGKADRKIADFYQGRAMRAWHAAWAK